MTLLERYARAQWQVAQGELQLRRQRALIETLQRSGKNVAAEQKLLRQLERIQALDLADCHRLRLQVDRSDPISVAL